MFEEKESFWKKKGFYLSACAAILCVLAIGTLYYKINYQGNNDTNLFADSATTSPNDVTSNVAGGSAISDADNAEDSNSSEDAVSVVQNNTPENATSAQPENTPANADNSIVSEADNNSIEDNPSQEESTDKKDTADIEKRKKQIETADSSKTDKAANKTNVAEKQDKSGSDKNDKTDKSTKKTDNADADNTVATMTETGTKNKFDIEKGLLWPVTGDIILKYSMSNTVYFKTLAQYKCNPAIIISSEEGTNVKAAADGIVTKVTKSDEVGNVVTVDIGSGYLVTYGQLDNISVKEGQPVKEGSSIGKIAKPTKYYSEEGSNLYLQVTEDDKPVDPMLLLR